MDKKSLIEWVEDLPDGAQITFCSYHEEDCLLATIEEVTFTELTHKKMNEPNNLELI